MRRFLPASPNNKGAFVFMSGGVAGVIRGDFDLDGVVEDTVILGINTTGQDVDETIVLAGETIQVKFTAAQEFRISLLNAAIRFGNWFSLTGNFQAEPGPTAGTSLYSGTNIEIFLGSGPLRTPEGDLNPDAIGIRVINGKFIAVYQSEDVYALLRRAAWSAWWTDRPGHREALVNRTGINLDGRAKCGPLQVTLPEGAGCQSPRMHVSGGPLEVVERPTSPRPPTSSP
jgi:hypothetical protein